MATISRPTEPRLRPVSFSMIEIACGAVVDEPGVAGGSRAITPSRRSPNSSWCTYSFSVGIVEQLRRSCRRSPRAAATSSSCGPSGTCTYARPASSYACRLCGESSSDTTCVKPLHRQPDQLFLAPHLAVVAGEAAGPLARAEAVLDHPREVAGLQPLRPAPAQPAGASCRHPFAASRVRSRRAARPRGATRRRRARARPRRRARSTRRSWRASRPRAPSTGASPSDAAEERLARRADEQRAPRRAPRAPAARASNARLCSASSRSRCRDRRGSHAASTPAATARVDPGAQLVADLARRRRRSRASSLHRARRAARVHHDEHRARRRRRRRSMSGSARAARDVVDHRRARVERGGRDRRPSSCRCSPGRRRRATSARTTGSDPAQLLVGVDRRRRRAGSTRRRRRAPPRPRAASARPCAIAASASR